MATLQAVLEHVDQIERGNDLLLLTGDLASDCQPEAYRLLDQLLSEQNRRVIWLPGNHDDFSVMQTTLVHYPAISVYEHDHWGILTLDSSIPGKTEGLVSQQQLRLLEEGLQQLANKYVLVAMHHSPVLIDCAWLDEHRIGNHHHLHQLLRDHGNVKAVIFGHVHQEYQTDWNGIDVYATPSTCVQFKPGTEDFELSDQTPGYRYFDLYPDGRLDTAVQFIEKSFL